MNRASSTSSLHEDLVRALTSAKRSVAAVRTRCSGGSAQRRRTADWLMPIKRPSVMMGLRSTYSEGDSNSGDPRLSRDVRVPSDAIHQSSSELPREQTGSEVQGRLSKDRPKPELVEGAWFKHSIAALLLLNSWVLALETDIPQWPWWDLVNGLFMLVYVIELALRLVHGPKQLLWTGKLRRWAAYDVLVVSLGLLELVARWFCGAKCAAALAGTGRPDDQQASPLRPVRHPEAAQRPPEQSWGTLALLRGLYVARLLRVGRVLRMIDQLKEQVDLLMEMQNTFRWILSIIFVLCFVLAIILTRLIGHGLIMGTEDAELSRKVRSMFANIPTSLFTLFQLTTAENWSVIATPLVSINALWRIFFVVFITFMSWTMLSLLAATASETMMTLTSNKKAEEKIHQEIQRCKFTTFLCEEFIRADTDGNNRLNKQEFMTLMEQPAMTEEMLTHGIALREQDISRTWDTFDIDESGELEIDELVTGFAYLHESLAMKHVANLSYSIKRFTVKMDSELHKLETVFDGLQQGMAPLVENTSALVETHSDNWAQFLSSGQASAQKRYNKKSHDSLNTRKSSISSAVGSLPPSVNLTQSMKRWGLGRAPSQSPEAQGLQGLMQ